MKIKFDIKYRHQIESGIYKVITASGEPVKIERWDLQGNYPILAVLPTTVSDYEGVNTWVEDRPFIYTKTGECHNVASSDQKSRIFIETGDELTESERMLYNLVNDHVYNHDNIDEEEVHEWMKENFIPALIEDCETKGDYFTADGIKYLNIKNYSDGL